MTDDEARLIEALRSETDRIVPSDRLGGILLRANHGTVLEMPKRPRWQVPLAVAAAAAVAATTWGVVTATQPTAPVLPGSTHSSPINTSDVPPTGTSATAPVGASPSVAPVYAVGPQAGPQSDLVLYRTFQPVAQTSTDPAQRLAHAIGGALTLSTFASAQGAGLEGSPTDGTPLGVTFGEATVSEEEIVVPLSAAGSVGTGGRAAADRVMAAWVRTAQAVVGKGDVPVRFTTPGDARVLGEFESTRSWNQADIASVPLADIWIDGPASTVTLGVRVKVSGQASVFEAALNWSLRRQPTPGEAYEQIDSGHTTAEAGAPARGGFSIDLGPLPAGAYEMVISTSAQDGSIAAQRTQTFSVQ